MYNLIRKIKRFNNEEEVTRGREKVITAREKRKRKEEEQLVKGKKERTNSTGIVI